MRIPSRDWPIRIKHWHPSITSHDKNPRFSNAERSKQLTINNGGKQKGAGLCYISDSIVERVFMMLCS